MQRMKTHKQWENDGSTDVVCKKDADGAIWAAHRGGTLNTIGNWGKNEKEGPRTPCCMM